MGRIVKTTFALVGSVAGAGFVSGRELVSFFGVGATVHLLCLAFLLFFLFFLLLLHAGRRYGSFAALLRARFGGAAGVAGACFLFGSFVLTCAMLAGINALSPAFSPWIALLTAGGCFLIAKKGIGGVKMLHAVLVPCIAAYLFFSLSTKRHTIVFSPENAGMGILFCALYVSMNLFLSAPVVVDLGGGLQREREAVFSSLTAAAVLAGMMFFILASIGGKAGAAARAVPLLAVLGDARAFPLALFGGMVTGLVSAYYPLHTAAERIRRQTAKNAARLLVLAAAFFCAGWGLERIVSLVYPALGVLGVLFLLSVVFDRQLFQKHDEKIHHARKQT